MSYRRNMLLTGIASLSLIAAAGLASAQEPGKEKAPAAKEPPAATQQMNKAPAMTPKGQSAQERPKSEPSNRAEETERTNKAGKSAEENKTTPPKPEENRAAQQKNEENSATQKTEENRAAQQKPDTGARGAESAQAKSSAAANAHLTADQRTRIKGTVFAAGGAPRVTNVNFDVHVGVVVPRGSVEYVPVPETLVQIEPMWQGFYYFVYGDELVIIDPDSLAIVAVVAV